MKSISELEKMAGSLFDEHSEFRRFDRIDGLLFLNLVQEEKSWLTIRAVADYLIKDYDSKKVKIFAPKLLVELENFERHFKQINHITTFLEGFMDNDHKIKKEFLIDCVELQRSIRRKKYALIKDLSPSEREEYFFRLRSSFLAECISKVKE